MWEDTVQCMIKPAILSLVILLCVLDEVCSLPVLLESPSLALRVYPTRGTVGGLFCTGLMMGAVGWLDWMDGAGWAGCEGTTEVGLTTGLPTGAGTLLTPPSLTMVTPPDVWFTWLLWTGGVGILLEKVNKLYVLQIIFSRKRGSVKLHILLTNYLLTFRPCLLA